MADFLPSFVTAPRLRLKVGDNVMAYAIGFDIRFGVSVQPVVPIGEFKPVALEPVMIGPVGGTMQIVRLLSKDTQGNQLALSPDGTVTTAANQQANPQTQSGNTAGSQNSNSLLEQKNLFRMLDPGQILMSTTFDVDVYMWRPVQGDGTSDITDLAQLPTAKLTTKLWMSIKNCRITSRNTNIAMGQLVNEPLNFQGLLVQPSTPGNFGLDSAIKDSTG